MRAATIRALALSTTILAGPAIAQNETTQPITAGGAAELSRSFATYLGQAALDKGILRVEPTGDAYRVTIDLQTLADGWVKPEDKASVTVSPIVMRTAPAGDGTWTVKIDNYPSLSLRRNAEKGEETIDFAVDNYAFEGVFDPRLAAFTTGRDRSSGIRMSTRSPEETVDVAYGAASSTFTSAAAGEGAVTGEWVFTSAGLTETIEMRGETPMRVAVKTGEIGMSFSATESRGPAMLDIVAFFAAHPEKDRIVAGQQDLRARLLAALPLWKATGGTVSAKDLAIDTPVGTFRAASFGQKASMSGIVADGSYSMTVSFSGFESPAGVMPDWTRALMPTELSLTADLSGLDLNSAARLAIETFDLSRPEPWTPEVQSRLMSILAGGTLKLTVPQSTVSSPAMTLAIEGNGTILPEAQGTATITAQGLDKALAELATSSDQDPNRAQALMVLGVAKNLAKPGEGGASVWTIEAAADGSVSVNGQMVQPPSK